MKDEQGLSESMLVLSIYEGMSRVYQRVCWSSLCRDEQGLSESMLVVSTYEGMSRVYQRVYASALYVGSISESMLVLSGMSRVYQRVC